MDLIESKIAIANGFIELNPLTNFFYNAGLLDIGKLGMIAIGTIALLGLHRYDKKLALECVVILVCCFVFIVVWNFIQWL